MTPPFAQLRTPIGHILHVLTARCAGPNHVRQVQARLVVLDLSCNTTLASRFINVCHSLGLSHLALRFFAHLPRPHVFICNTLIRAFSLARTPRVPFSVYAHMRKNSIHPNNFTFPFLLKSLADSGEFRRGLCVHTHVVKISHLEDIFVRNSLLNLYASRGGDMALCRQMFDEIPHRDVVSWTVLITGYRKVRRFGDVLMAFEQMLLSKLDPNRVTMVNVLAACSSVREVGMGMWVHDFVRRRCWELDVTLGTALVNMYMRCGRVDEGLKAFHSVKEKSALTWNMVIKGLALAKNGDEVVSWFNKMQREGVKVDEETLVAVLSACSQSGLIEKGREIFSALLNGEFGISAGIKHYEFDRMTPTTVMMSVGVAYEPS
ncbi:pentatricopeptide repeat-containing protein At3g47530-like [Rhodamnia argentea]|uniref:Pentatricopeptide repeat-containing protein At3g47530-like n=1 Tax=Rhodamnia argentea TaxID=178133 RepID=A0A8B8Q7X7_9MYRT|nr:pentatricopeptide repeat-containing protein At3g47530-like [Rhodamnia argentea]